jgi:hypothetical protein
MGSAMIINFLHKLTQWLNNDFPHLFANLFPQDNLLVK